MRRLLNVGGNNKQFPIPQMFTGWEHHLLDIKPGADVDLVIDARQLQSLPAKQYHAVYCSHNLEHYYEHEAAQVLAGFRHILTPDGLIYLIVPDLLQVLERMVLKRHEPDDVLYHSAAGPIRYCDVIYGHTDTLAQTGQDYHAHKTGFSPKLLHKCLHRAGFTWFSVQPLPSQYEIHAVASIQPLAGWVQELLGL